MKQFALLLLLLVLAGSIVPAAAPRSESGRARRAQTDRFSVVPLVTSLSAQASFSLPSAGRGPAAPFSSIGTALMGGWISWAEPDLGPDYLATRFPRGTLVRICAVECLVRYTTDFGPSAAIDPPRIADLSVLDWEAISGLPRARGLVRGTVEAIDAVPLPATSTGGNR